MPTTRTFAPLPILALIGMALLCGCGASTPEGGAVVLRYEPAVGSSVRYRVVIRSVPGDVPGRTVTGSGALSIQGVEDTGTHRQVLTLDTIHVAGETGRPVASRGELHVTQALDPHRVPDGEPEVEGADVRGARELLRAALGDALTFPPGAVGVGDTWNLPAASRLVADDVSVSIPREARLEGVEAGVATVVLSGSGSTQLEVGAVRVTAQAELSGRARVRVADGQLVERDTAVEITLIVGGADGEVLGQRTHHSSTRVERVTRAMPEPASHDWRPDHIDATCQARLRAMGRRFERAPQTGVSSLPWFPIGLLASAEGRDIDEEGPVLVGIDGETMAGAREGADLGRAVVVYVAAPAAAGEAELLHWLEIVPSYIELRRLVERPVDPPAPRASAEVEALAVRMRGEGSDVWEGAIAPYLALCGGARSALSEHGPTPALRAPLAEGLERCGCGVTNLPDLEALIDLRVGGPELGWIPLRR